MFTFDPNHIDAQKTALFVSLLVTIPLSIAGFVLSLINYHRAKDKFRVGVVFTKIVFTAFKDERLNAMVPVNWHVRTTISNVGNRTFTIVALGFVAAKNPKEQEFSDAKDQPITLQPGESKGFEFKSPQDQPCKMFVHLHNGKVHEQPIRRADFMSRIERKMESHEIQTWDFAQEVLAQAESEK
jgi:hypothetical protein